VVGKARACSVSPARTTPDRQSGPAGPRCTVGTSRIDPFETLGIQPSKPLPYWGWGDIPDQYHRRWDGDDGETPMPPDPGPSDLPPLRSMWGPEAPRTRRPLNSL
jgi:hypothetical protein